MTALKHNLTLAYALIAFIGYGQHASLKKADSYFDQFQFAKAAERYEKILAVDSTSMKAMNQLVLCYSKLNNPENAEKWLYKICNTENVRAEDLKRYAQVLAENGKYEASAQWYQKYLSAASDDHAARTVASYQSLQTFYSDSSFYKIKPFAANSDQSDFGPTFYKDGIVFCSARKTGKKSNIYSWDGSEFIDLYFAKENVATAVRLGKPINSVLHEGPASFSDNGDTIYFTRNNTSNQNKTNRVVRLKLYYSVLLNGQWSKEKEFSFNSNEYSMGHPTLSKDGKLFFVSDQPGGIGGTDIYYTALINGVWAEPVNVGNKINTSGNEMFPFVDDQGNLYFASDTHPGLGGLDIFYSKLENGEYTTPKNMGWPVNTSKDDFGMIIQGDLGYFSSNRGAQPQDDNIYQVVISRNKSIQIVAVSESGLELKDFQLTIKEGEKSSTENIFSLFDGKFNCEKNYVIECSKNGYEKQTLLLHAEQLKRLLNNEKLEIKLTEATRLVNLQPEPVLFEKNEVGQEVELEIRYDVNKSNIRPDAACELDKLVVFLQKNPNVKVELGSHTDARGGHEANHQLSQRRAQAAVRYLVSKGIASQQLVPVGFGETDLKIKNAATEADHQQNRRTTVKIVEVGQVAGPKV